MVAHIAVTAIKIVENPRRTVASGQKMTGIPRKTGVSFL
jgi:hypothetical protein